MSDFRTRAAIDLTACETKIADLLAQASKETRIERKDYLGRQLWVQRVNQLTLQKCLAGVAYGEYPCDERAGFQPRTEVGFEDRWRDDKRAR